MNFLLFARSDHVAMASRPIAVTTPDSTSLHRRHDRAGHRMTTLYVDAAANSADHTGRRTTKVYVDA